MDNQCVASLLENVWIDHQFLWQVGETTGEFTPDLLYGKFIGWWPWEGMGLGHAIFMRIQREQKARLRLVAHLGNIKLIRKWFNHRSREMAMNWDMEIRSTKRIGEKAPIRDLVHLGDWRLLYGWSWAGLRLQSIGAWELPDGNGERERESLELLDKELTCLSKRSPGKYKVCIFW